MTRRKFTSFDRTMRRAWLLVIWATSALLIVSCFLFISIESYIAFSIIVVASVVPTILWLRIGAPGIPVWPVVAALHFIYFGVPILREDVSIREYEPLEILQGSITVILFLAAATSTWWIVLGLSIRQSRAIRTYSIPRRRIVQFVFSGLSVGLIYHLALMIGILSDLGSFFGVVRSIGLTATSIASFLTGYCVAVGHLRGTSWRLAIGAVAASIALSWMSLLLVQGMIYLMAMVLGYAIVTKRIPWKSLLSAAAVVFVLHAGKAEMRQEYWAPDRENGISVLETPGFLMGWFVQGIEAIAAGRASQDIMARASLFGILLNVERVTPQYIPYLGGETYALLPSYLVPRFLDPSKSNSQAGLALLNIRYGKQSEETSKSTTIGWGVISEAYANFGNLGVLILGLIFGGLAGMFTRISAGASPISISTLLSVAALITLINLEADFGYLMVNLWQALIAAAAFSWPLRLMAGREQKLASARNMKAPRPFSPT